MSKGIVDVNKDEFLRFKLWSSNGRWGWPAKLSTNDWRDLWEPPGWGYTKVHDREQVRNEFPFVDELVEEYLTLRPGGGRFFIDDQIAYYRPDEEGDPTYAIALLRIKA
jgi:hypothetical protein